MKIVVNRCFGGFGLSDKAYEQYLYRKGINLYTVKKNSWGSEYRSFDGAYLNPSNIERTDQDLIAVVEELGPEANDRYSDLQIVDIPDDVDWEIDEYDGIETIRECSRSW